MKKIVLQLILCCIFLSAHAQSNSVYHIETEYTPQNGYRYYFDKMDPQTGTSTRLSLLPVEGFFTGYAFFNCFDHYVFEGVDSILPNGDYINKLYELDTLGNLVRTVPMDTTNGTWYKMVLPSANSAHYFALRWDLSGHYVIETINAINGARTTQTLTPLDYYIYLNSDAAITRDNVIWMGMDDQMIGASVLMSIDPSTGAVTFQDTLSPGYYYDCLNYGCENDTIYGFLAHNDSIQGAELLKIHGASSTVIHSGITATGSGQFFAGTHARLPDGSFYAKTSVFTYLLPDFYVSSPTFSMPAVPGTSLPAFCYAAPRESCTWYITCNKTSAIGENRPANQFILFPNPVTGGILSIQQAGDFSVELIDASGRLVYSGKGTNTMTVSVAGFASGIYAVRIIQNQESNVSKVLIAD